jgi:hypothetical protein
MDGSSVEDRRESRRYEVGDSLYVAIRPTFDRLGKIADISRSGVAFEYPAYESCEQIDSVEVDIFSRIDDLHMSRVPCKVIYDIKAIEYPTFSKVETRRCGLQFQKLAPLQLRKLKSLQSSWEKDSLM